MAIKLLVYPGSGGVWQQVVGFWLKPHTPRVNVYLAARNFDDSQVLQAWCSGRNPDEQNNLKVQRLDARLTFQFEGVSFATDAGNYDTLCAQLDVFNSYVVRGLMLDTAKYIGFYPSQLSGMAPVINLVDPALNYGITPLDGRHYYYRKDDPHGYFLKQQLLESQRYLLEK